MTRDAEDLLRAVLTDPAYDVTPDGDPLAPVWGKARSIRRRRALTAGGTAVVVAGALIAGGIAITRPEAKGGTGVVGVVTASPSVPAPSSVPSSAAGPTATPSPSGAGQPARAFTRANVHLNAPVAIGTDVVGIEIGEGGPTSFRIAVVNTSSGHTQYTPTIAGAAQGVAIADGAIWVTTLHTAKLIRFDLADLSRLPDVLDPNGELVGPIATVGNYVAVADGQGVSLVREGIATPAPVLRQGLVCSIATATAAGGLLVLGGDPGGACRDVIAVNLSAGTHTVVATASDLALGLQGVVADTSGFWVEQPTGTMGFYEHVAYTTTGGAPVVGPDHVSGSNSMGASVADGHTWISDPGSLRCVDSDAHVLWSKDLPTDDGRGQVLVTTAGAVLATTTYLEAFDTSVC